MRPVRTGNNAARVCEGATRGNERSKKESDFLMAPKGGRARTGERQKGSQHEEKERPMKSANRQTRRQNVAKLASGQARRVLREGGAGGGIQ